MQSTLRPPAVILGSAFSHGARPDPALGELVADTIRTSWGPVPLFRHRQTDGVVLFRHGLPHRLLPHQIPWRAQAAALRALDVRALLLTSSVGVLVDDLPLYEPHLAGDLVMVDNRLPDGSMCTMWPEHHPKQGHLVVQEGLFSQALGAWLQHSAHLPERRLCFAYVPGPRTKTAAENRLLREQGIEVNSMSIGPEVVLANELEIPTVALLTGHKASSTGGPSSAAISDSLDRARTANLAVILQFLAAAPSVAYRNLVYRFASGDPA